MSREKYITAKPGAEMQEPDLLIAFGVNPEAYLEDNGFIISEQGKPPDLVLEIASEGTGHIDIGEKREFYERLGIPEYWRFDKTGRYHRTRLAADRLVEGRYEPMDIEEVEDGVLQGRSAMLNLNWRWENGRLTCHDPATGQHIATFDDEREARIGAEARATYAEARVRELEEENQRLRGG